MVTTRFPVVKCQARRTVECRACGKRRTRQMTVENTVSPFNQNPDGTVRTWGEVQAKVDAEAAAWRPTLCASCEPLHRPSDWRVKRSEFVGDCVCGNRWPCELTEDFDEVESKPCLCQPIGRICERCVTLGREFDKVVSPS